MTTRVTKPLISLTAGLLCTIIASAFFASGGASHGAPPEAADSAQPITDGLHAKPGAAPGAALVPSVEERYGPVDAALWNPDLLLWNASPVDLSHLNEKPAGARGFVRAVGDRLVFEDGSFARFWGGNLAAYALFRPKEQVEEQARRIAQLGFNLMRLHHHDSTRWVDPTVIDKNRDDSKNDSSGDLRVQRTVKIYHTLEAPVQPSRKQNENCKT